MICWRKEKRQQNYTLNCPCMKVMCYLCRKTIQGTNDWWLLRGQFCTETIKSIEVESHTKDGVLRHYDGSLLTLIDRSLQFRNIFLGRNRNGYADGIIISIATPSCKQYATCHGNGQHGECSPNQKCRLGTTTATDAVSSASSSSIVITGTSPSVWSMAEVLSSASMMMGLLFKYFSRPCSCFPSFLFHERLQFFQGLF